MIDKSVTCKNFNLLIIDIFTHITTNNQLLKSYWKFKKDKSNFQDWDEISALFNRSPQIFIEYFSNK